MTRALVVGFALVLALGCGAAADEGQGPGDTSQSTLAQVGLGDYWYGAKLEKEDLVGKVVLFEIWGS
ncbi:MAG: hypothetical protein O2894_04475 [Planctomycetota bacterium]|nr:hypothetical protein [Planctomycetota bacterium]